MTYGMPDVKSDVKSDVNLDVSKVVSFAHRFRCGRGE
jgi:hypothetical protein